MEGNRDEARRCRDIALQAWENGDSAKATRFLTKAMRMDPNPEYATLLERVKSGVSRPRQSQAPSATSTRQSQTSTSPHAKESDPTPTQQRSYTVQQESLCRQILGSKTYYEMLNVKSDASEDAIKKAYRKLALQLHPDKNSAPKAEEAFKKVSRAFQTLSDPQKRARYDHTGQEDDQPQTASQQDSGFMTAEELFQAFFGVGGTTIYTGPDGRTFVQRRRVPRQHMPPQSEAQRRIYNLLQLLPVFIIVLFSILGSDFFQSQRADFRLVKTRDTPLLMETSRHNVPFFASPSYESRYPPGSLSRDRSEAEIEYGYFWAECRKAHETLRRDLEYYQAIGHRSKTNELAKELRQKENDHADCRHMRDLQRQYPSEANKVRTGHSTVLPGYRTW